MQNELCNQCLNNEQCEMDCPALSALNKICKLQLIEQKTALINEYAKEIGLIKFEIAPDLAELGDKVLSAMPEFAFINNHGVKIGYLKSYENKKASGKTVFAECRIIKGVYTAYLPFDFIITFYQFAISSLTKNQLKILMLHELKHIGLNKAGYTLNPHDIEDFSDILSKYGLGWSALNQDVPDILDGIDNVESSE